ncbi:glycosyltransferase family 4 protein [Anaerocolumna aminovalerica]|uniref:glycosyltransferase n=1 Tax=Anaerocolumna aminovalerica TaxID=1527 RepID=UPI001C0EF18F|nr:glycosyltransferase [Anaerocolumna aminovalerica]MBU5331135.1 glycosyltransferase family 4 protein [Anaerocolumna aminovalerica]
MKLVFVTDNGFSSHNNSYYYSGANVQHYSTVTEFFDDIVFIARDSQYEPSSSMISSKYKTYLIKSITSKGNILRNYKKIDKILEETIPNSDIIMCFGLNGYLAYKKAKKYGKPTITFVGGCVYEILINMDSKFKRMFAPIMMKLIKEMAKNSDYVHYVDSFLYDRYPTKNNYLICSDSTIEIDDEVLVSRIKRIKSSDKRNSVVVGIIGYTHNRIKGIDTAIRAFSMLGNEYKLQVVGRGDHTWLDKIARNLKVENRIEFLGILNGRSEIFKWLDSIDIYLQPSLTEGMPRATLEAISRGCPVISTSVGGLVTLINEDDRINTGDYKNLAYKIDLFGKNRHLLLEKAVRNYSTAKSYDSKKLNKIRNNFYGDIAKSIQKKNFKRENNDS